jgi:hypothetical protein
VTRVEVNRTCGCSSAPKKFGRLEMLVACGAAGVDARGVDRQLDRGAARAHDVRAAEAAEAAAYGVQAPEVLDLELERRPAEIGRPLLERRLRCDSCAAHLVSLLVGIGSSIARAAAMLLPRGGHAAASC